MLCYKYFISTVNWNKLFGVFTFLYLTGKLLINASFRLIPSLLNCARALPNDPNFVHFKRFQRMFFFIFLVCSTKWVYDGSKRQPKVALPPVLMAPASSDSSTPWRSKQKSLLTLKSLHKSWKDFPNSPQKQFLHSEHVALFPLNEIK